MSQSAGKYWHQILTVHTEEVSQGVPHAKEACKPFKKTGRLQDHRGMTADVMCNTGSQLQQQAKNTER